MSNENEEMIANINSNPESDLSSFTKKSSKNNFVDERK